MDALAFGPAGCSFKSQISTSSRVSFSGKILNITISVKTCVVLLLIPSFKIHLSCPFTSQVRITARPFLDSVTQRVAL